MLLGDKSETGGPHDPFKTDRVRYHISRDIPEKVTNINHFDNSKLNSVISPIKDFMRQVTWSEAMDQFSGKDRLFTKVIKNALAQEANDLRREKEIEALKLLPKRGAKPVDTNDALPGTSYSTLSNNN